MARADSTIHIDIEGDAKDLSRAANDAEKSTKGLSKQAKLLGGALVAGFAADAVIDFGQAALAEADRVGDATGRLEAQLGDLSTELITTSENFTHLGQSKQDMLELEAAMVDVGTALGIADDQLAPLAIDAAEAAGALSLITDTDAETWMGTLGKAAGGSSKALKLLGVDINETDVVAAALAATGKTTADSLTEGELAAARMDLILQALNPRLEGTKSGLQDTEQATADAQAKWETFMGKIGEGLEGFLNDLTVWILKGIDGWALFAAWLDTNADKIAELGTPLGVVADWLGKIVGLLQQINKIGLPSWLGTGAGGPVSFPRGAGAGGGRGPGITVQVQGGSPEVIEQAVRRAVATAARHGS